MLTFFDGRTLPLQRFLELTGRDEDVEELSGRRFREFTRAEAAVGVVVFDVAADDDCTYDFRGADDEVAAEVGRCRREVEVVVALAVGVDGLALGIPLLFD